MPDAAVLYTLTRRSCKRGNLSPASTPGCPRLHCSEPLWASALKPDRNRPISCHTVHPDFWVLKVFCYIAIFQFAEQPPSLPANHKHWGFISQNRTFFAMLSSQRAAIRAVAVVVLPVPGGPWIRQVLVESANLIAWIWTTQNDGVNLIGMAA